MDPSRPTAASDIPANSSDGIRDSGTAVTADARSSRIGYFRWVICGLLLLGITKNYMDRQVLGVLKSTLQQTFSWNEIDYGNLVAAFQMAYALGLLLTGRLIDKLGTRLGYALAVIFWSLASMATAFAHSFTAFAFSRYALGFGEAAVFPASLKAVAEWFPKKERALATGIFNAGTNMGAIITPLVVPWLVSRWGWRGAFIAVGALGFAWLALWLVVYRKPEEHSFVSQSELLLIRSDPPAPAIKTAWAILLPMRQTWAFVIAKFLTDPVWWFYLFWVPGFLQRNHGLTLSGIGLPVVTIYLISDVGSVAGGWFSSFLIRRGHTISFARKTAMLVCAVGVIPVVFAHRVENLWSAVLLIGLAAACHQGFSANLFTLPSDMFPTQAVGSVVGIGGMAGATGGMLFAGVIGHVLQWTGSYKIPFVIAGSAYLLALAFIHLLVPRLDPATVASSQTTFEKIAP